MDSLFSILFTTIAALGLCAIVVGLLHPAPGKTRLIRALCWPGFSPSDHIALPLGSFIFCIGAALASSSWLPVSFRIGLALAGFVSAIVLLRRRGA
jgi:hypothetical protein